MASGYRVATGWNTAWESPGRGSGMAFPTAQTQANTQQALAPTQAAGPLGSSFGLGLPAGYASALTQYLDPQAMEAQIRADAQIAAGNAAADRGFGLGDNIGARLTGEIQAPALQAYRMNLLNQIPQFWQMEQQQKMAQQQEEDRRRELAYEREQRGWTLEDRKYQERLQDEAERKYRQTGVYTQPQSGSSAGGSWIPGADGAGSGTGSIIGGPATSSSTFGRSNLTSSTGQSAFGAKKPYTPYPGQYETKEQAAARGAGGGGGGGGGVSDSDLQNAGFDFTGSPNKNTGGAQVPGVSGAGPSVSSLQNNTSTFAASKLKDWWK